MDIDQYKEAIEYEQLTQAIYQAILQNESSNNIRVEHNVDVVGRSGVTHQIDVLWRFRQAGIEHTVLIECKNYASNLTLEKVRNYFGVIHDIGNAQGLIVTKTGYQSGAAQFANHYGIGLKVLRKPNELDWQGRVKDIHITVTAKSVASSKEKPLRAQVLLKPRDESQRVRLEALMEHGLMNVPSGTDLRFHDKEGRIISEEMRWWLPKQLETLDKEDSGPYTQEVKLQDIYLLVNEDDPNEELIEVDKLIITYFVESFSEEIISHGEQIVEAILKDFNTAEVELLIYNKN